MVRLVVCLNQPPGAASDQQPLYFEILFELRTTGCGGQLMFAVFTLNSTFHHSFDHFKTFDNVSTLLTLFRGRM